MRVIQDPNSAEFAQWLLEMGEGRGPEDGTIRLPDHMNCGKTMTDLINAIYSRVKPDSPIPGDQYFLERTILTCRNSEVTIFNSLILEKFPGHVRTLLSADSIQKEAGVDGEDVYPVEFLNSLESSGLAPH